MIKAIDCEYVGYDKLTGKYHVHEQLYPESRGFIVHEFDTEEEAKKIIDTPDITFNAPKKSS